MPVWIRKGKQQCHTGGTAYVINKRAVYGMRALGSDMLVSKKCAMLNLPKPRTPMHFGKINVLRDGDDTELINIKCNNSMRFLESLPNVRIRFSDSYNVISNELPSKTSCKY